ncbi:hypothetical protein [Nocardia jiangxiensis]|uniref:hypothetical protein n=1 Tax=Nocardia jiangxiensis TaxID=282685 RepID=UPI00031664E0|nr:hypothetical protein [Nocardia jiangxiensis]
MNIYEVAAAPDCSPDEHGFVRGYWLIRVSVGSFERQYTQAIDKDTVAGMAIDLLSVWLDVTTDSFAVTVTYLDRIPDSWRDD